MKISVCMAVYNGSRFLETQLKSILGQLSEADEVVVVDDRSTDSSRDLIRSLQSRDRRIRHYVNECNRGPVRSFERALSMCSGDVILFSDQDDEWLPTKIARTLRALQTSGKAAVVSDAAVVDEGGSLMMASFFGYRRSGPGLLKNFYKNTYLGCCLAIDGRMKEVVLPFPRTIAQHDEWIGWASEFVGGVEFLRERLVAYRRHAANVTGLTPSKWQKTVAYRFGLLTAILARAPKLLSARVTWRRTKVPPP